MRGQDMTLCALDRDASKADQSGKAFDRLDWCHNRCFSLSQLAPITPEAVYQTPDCHATVMTGNGVIMFK